MHASHKGEKRCCQAVEALANWSVGEEGDELVADGRRQLLSHLGTARQEPCSLLAFHCTLPRVI